jgi:predicted pyridoxine 5'-phosphate oxidase superfamily flavin-nucleotide-binding protein
VALLFLIPGSGTTLRVNGHGMLYADADLLARFEVEGKRPRSVLRVAVSEVYFQCARAIVRSGLWDPAKHVDAAALPTPGAMLAAMSDGAEGGAPYDAGWTQRAAASLW